MDEIEQTEEELTTCIQDLFLDNEYLEWRSNLKTSTEGNWHSLVANLNMRNVPVEKFLCFGKDISSKLVFNYVKAPDYKSSKMLMIQFTVSGSMWHTIIWHCPERN